MASALSASAFAPSNIHCGIDGEISVNSKNLDLQNVRMNQNSDLLKIKVPRLIH